MKRQRTDEASDSFQDIDFNEKSQVFRIDISIFYNIDGSYHDVYLYSRGILYTNIIDQRLNIISISNQNHNYLYLKNAI